LEVSIKVNSKEKHEVRLPPYTVIYESRIMLVTDAADARQPFWGKIFDLTIVESVPGTWLSKITNDLHGDKLAAYDPSSIFLLTKEWAGFFREHAKVVGSVNEYVPDLYKSGNIPDDYQEWAFNPDVIYPGQRFFFLKPQKNAVIESFDPEIIDAELPTSILDNLWVGVGVSEQTDWVVVGQHIIETWVHNMGRYPPDKSWLIQSDGYQFGLGFGVSGGLVLQVIHGVHDRSILPSISMGWDFEISIGTKITGLLKAAKFIKIAKALTKTGKFLDQKTYKALKYVGTVLVKNRDAIFEPGVISLPIPLLGAGAHLWAGYKFGDVKLLREFNEK
jgi:hypothetical protein